MHNLQATIRLQGILAVNTSRCSLIPCRPRIKYLQTELTVFCRCKVLKQQETLSITGQVGSPYLSFYLDTLQNKAKLAIYTTCSEALYSLHKLFKFQATLSITGYADSLNPPRWLWQCLFCMSECESHFGCACNQYRLLWLWQRWHHQCQPGASARVAQGGAHRVPCRLLPFPSACTPNPAACCRAICAVL